MFLSVGDWLCGCLSAADGLSPDTRPAWVSRNTFCSNLNVLEWSQPDARVAKCSHLSFILWKKKGKVQSQLKLLSTASIRWDLILHTKFVESLTPQRDAIILQPYYIPNSAVTGLTRSHFWGEDPSFICQNNAFFHIPKRSFIYAISQCRTRFQQIIIIQERFFFFLLPCKIFGLLITWW